MDAEGNAELSVSYVRLDDQRKRVKRLVDSAMVVCFKVCVKLFPRDLAGQKEKPLEVSPAKFPAVRIIDRAGYEVDVSNVYIFRLAIGFHSANLRV